MSQAEDASALAGDGYQRELAGGLLLRWSRAEDRERLAALVAAVFRHDSDEASDPAVMSPRTLEFMSGQHPLMRQNDFALVEDPTSGQIVSASCLLREAWEYEGVRLPVGRPEAVVTRRDYRRRGLVRAIFELLHARSAARGDAIQAITGIPWFYRQFGYGYGLELRGGVRVTVTDVPPLAGGASDSYTLRPADSADIPDIARMYDEERAGYLVSTPITNDLWRFWIKRATARPDARARPWALCDHDGSMSGYVMCGPQHDPGELVIEGLWLKPGLWLDALPTLLRRLRDLGMAFMAQEATAAPFSSLALYLPATHPLHSGLRAANIAVSDKDDDYAWYIRIPDPAGLLWRLSPVLERRLAASPFARYSGALEIDLYRDGVRLVFEQGKLSDVVEWREPVPGREPSAGIPPEVFPQLVFGYRDLREMRHICADVQVKGTPGALLAALFPKGDSWGLPLG